MPSADIENSNASRLKKALYVIIIVLAANIALHLVFASFTYKGDVSAVSHRGAAAVAPENTLAGVSAGVDAGAPYIEVDIRATKDGVLVLMHDSTVNRTTDGSGAVGDLFWDYVRRLDASARFGTEFKGERVPRLDNILEYMKGKPSKLVLEVKSPGRYPGIGTLLREALREYGIEREVVVISFDSEWIKRIGI